MNASALLLLSLLPSVGPPPNHLSVRGEWITHVALRWKYPERANVLASGLSPSGRLYWTQTEKDIGVWRLGDARKLASFPLSQPPSNVFFRVTGAHRVICLDGKYLYVIDFSPGVEPATRDTLRTHWNDLASPDAARAFRALHALALVPHLAGPYVERHLAVTPAPPDLAACIERLAADSFAVRQEATRCLERADETARPALEKAATHSDLEIRRRATKLLLRLDRPSARTLQLLRAIELLEMLRRPAALRRLAEGPDASYVTRDARAALDRLSREMHP